MRKGAMMQTAKLSTLIGRCAVAGVLAFGIAFAGVAGAVSTPQTAFADTDDGAATQVHATDEPVSITKDGVRLTKLTRNTVLVELTEANTLCAVDVGLEPRATDGQALEGARFSFTPEALALATHHDVANGAEIRVIVTNGMQPLSSDGGSFVLGELAVPEEASKVAFTKLVQVEEGGLETGSGISPYNVLVLDEGSAPGPGEGDTTNNGSGNATTNTGNTTDTGSMGNTTNTGNGTPSGNPSHAGNTSNTGGGSDNGGSGGSTGGSGNGGANNNGVGGTTSNGTNLPQTGDPQVLDASAFLLIGGAAALIAAVIILIRRKGTRIP